MLLVVNEEYYREFVHITAKGERLLYVLLGKALYGCLKSARLFWEHLKKVLKRIGFVLNRHDCCVTNKVINGGQCTITWHVDYLKISHREATVVKEIIIEIEEVYGKMTVNHFDSQEYVGMHFEYL